MNFLSINQKNLQKLEFSSNMFKNLRPVIYFMFLLTLWFDFSNRNEEEAIFTNFLESKLLVVASWNYLKVLGVNHAPGIVFIHLFSTHSILNSVLRVVYDDTIVSHKKCNLNASAFSSNYYMHNVWMCAFHLLYGYIWAIIN